MFYLYVFIICNFFFSNRPLDSKLKYQIDKLVKVAATGAVDTLDPTRFKANPKALAASRFNTADDDEDLDEESAFGAKSSGGDKKTKKKRESEEENGDNDNEERFSSELAGANAALSGKYVPPKIASVAFDGDSATNKRLQKEEKLKRKALKSSLIKDIQEEFSDKPREIRDTAGFGGKDILPDQEEEDYRRRFEEDHFVRLTTKKKTGKAARLPNELNSLVDFGDIGGLDRLVSRGGNDLEDDADLRKVFKKSSLREKLNEMRNRDSEESSTSRKKGRFDAPIEEDDYYKEILAKTTERKEKKAMEKESR